MHGLRSFRWIAQLVLAWFALFLGSAIASTVIEPDSVQIVCAAGGGMKMVDMSEDDEALMSTLSLDCPLCAFVTVPLLTSSARFEQLSSLAHALHPFAAAHMASVTAPPLPSRGPPALLQ
jgi:glucan phosphoethanolaminetransferase (alkaline phosphatase superfamily)